MLLCGRAIYGRKLHQLILRGTSRKAGPFGVGRVLGDEYCFWAEGMKLIGEDWGWHPGRKESKLLQR